MTTATEGIEFTERRGFTVIGGHPTRIGPVTVRIDGSRPSFEALRAAAGHAMTRTCGMVVFNGTGDVDTAESFSDIDDREQAVAHGILQNNHVSVVDTETTRLIDLVAGLEEMGASLLVLNSEESQQTIASPALMSRLLSADIDVLMLSAGQTRHA